MKTIVELYEDEAFDKVIAKYARMNFLDREDLKQEVFLGILSEYGESFDAEKYTKKIAMRMKRAEQRERQNATEFDERLDSVDMRNANESWSYYFGDDDEADHPTLEHSGDYWRNVYWRGVSPEMNQDVEGYQSYSKRWEKEQRERKAKAVV